MPKTNTILVHTCCAPCAAPSGEKLLLEGYKVTLFYSNSNIYPVEEYEKRLKEVRKLANIWDIIIEEDIYDHKKWQQHIKGFEDEPEKGNRCHKCFEFSLQRTAELTDRLDFTAFTTTLTLSPHKISKMVFDIGKKYPKYMPFDFKKQNGFLKSLHLSEEYDLYRQNYCGCEFSLRDTK